MYFYVVCGKKFNLRDLNEAVLLHQDMGFGPKYIHYERQIEYDTLAKEAIRTVAKVEAISEEMRVLYVALTRAKEKLIMIGCQKDAEKQLEEKAELLGEEKARKLAPQIVKQYMTYLDWLELVYIQHKEELLFLIHTQDELENKVEEKTELNFQENSKVSEQLKQQLKEKIEWQYAKQELASIPSKSSVTKLKELHSFLPEEEENEVQECILPLPEFLNSEKKLTGAQRGTIMHFVLQKLNLKKQYTADELQEFVAELQVKKLLTEQEAEAVSIDKLEKFLASNLAKDIREAREIYQEKPFYLYLPAKEIYGGDIEEKVVVQGIIDLYYRNKAGELILVDYKTDFVENGNPEQLVQKYQKQIETYKRALEQGTGEKVRSAYIYSIYLNEVIEIG